MKIKTIHFLLIVPLITSGCFSIATRGGGGWEGNPSGKQIVAAAALDTVTLPIQIPFLAVAAADARKIESWGSKEKRLATLLEANPRVALQERWDLKGGEYECAFVESFTNPNVKYTDELLEAIHQNCPSVKDYVFRSKSCSRGFLIQHFDEEYQIGMNWESYFGLKNIVSNPNTPIELVEKVASSQTRSGAVEPAKKAIVQRKAEQVTDPTNK